LNPVRAGKLSTRARTAIEKPPPARRRGGTPATAPTWPVERSTAPATGGETLNHPGGQLRALQLLPDSVEHNDAWWRDD